MKPKMSGKSHLFHGMVNLMKFPKIRHMVEQPMNPPLYEISYNEANNQDYPQGCTLKWVDSGEVQMEKPEDKIIEEIDYYP
jgi:hypothetical protein